MQLDREHIDPITYNQIGVYYRGTSDAPQKHSSVKLKVRMKEDKRVIWRQKIFSVIVDDFFLNLIMVSFNA